MRNRISINEPELINVQNINILNQRAFTSNYVVHDNSNLEIFISEGCENFVSYIDWLGLAKDTDLVVLSSMHHYYYDAEELKNVRTLVNLKELNCIKGINSLFHSIFNLLPEKSHFIGCFTDNKRINGYPLRNKSFRDQTDKISDAIENGIISRNPFLNMIYSIMDYKTNRYLSRNDVTLLLEGRGFKILDMTELLGKTYFCTQKISSGTY
jgi:hypothetical protein